MKKKNAVVLYAFKEKSCTRCKETKPIEAFGKHAARASGVREYCRTCHAKETIKWQSANTEKHALKQKRYELRKHHDISMDRYMEMFSKQDGCCAICGENQLNLRRSLEVDHCHLTGKIRELLCHECNFGIGRFSDSIDFLESAIAYIRRHQT